ncbi:MAG TPA: hypothetical protein PKY16_05835, partial [Gemmiger qucibialis]|nr:hypothetical protein [Gemmiger qucibialis]
MQNSQKIAHFASKPRFLLEMGLFCFLGKGRGIGGFRRVISGMAHHTFLRQYRIILSAAAAGAVLKPQGGNCAV